MSDSCKQCLDTGLKTTCEYSPAGTTLENAKAVTEIVSYCDCPKGRDRKEYYHTKKEA